MYKDDLYIVDAIQPVINGVCQDDSVRKIGIIGTQVTIQSEVYERRFKAQKPDLEVISLATPLLVPMIEAGNFNDEMFDKKGYFESLKQRCESVRQYRFCSKRSRVGFKTAVFVGR